MMDIFIDLQVLNAPDLPGAKIERNITKNPCLEAYQ
jgi:hypothetical protein